MDEQLTFDPQDVARWAGGRWRLAPREPITGCSIDTRAIKPGHLFIALRGEHVDGHAYVVEALNRGASAVMVERAEAVPASLPCLIVPDVRVALMALAEGYRDTLSCRMVAVTGSVGKTTVKELLADMLHHVGITARTKGNWNNDIGMPLSLLATHPDTQFGVFEVGMNHPGELDPLCRVLRPDVSVVTCVGPVHIEHFENEGAIAEEKAAVYRGLKGKGIAILNADDPHAAALQRHTAGSRVVSVSSRPGADYVYRRVDPESGRFEILEPATRERVEMTAALPGEYFVLDAALSAAAARVLGVGWAVIRDAVQFYQPLSMRWNRHNWFGVHTINDAYNANPVSVRAAIQAFTEQPVRGTRWLVLAGMLELGEHEERRHREIGAFCARFPGLRLVAVGPRGAWIAAGAAAGGLPGSDIHAFPDGDAAAHFLAAALAPHDTVLFKASRGEAMENVLRQWIALKEARG
jgi:UDP-N-acetylmuramoyl-tripeptide--D-alanyl-D-alanine ligase